MVSSVSNTQSPTSNTFSSQLGADYVNQQDFLQLLVAQLKNQDPLNPMENQEFVSELAVFSQLEQSTNQTKLLETIANNDSSTATTQALSLIGKEAAVQTGSVNFTPGQELSFVFQAPSAGTYTVQALTESGRVAFTDQIYVDSAGQHTYSFDGTNGKGGDLGAGSYQVQIGSGSNSDGQLNQLPMYLRGEVEGVNFVDGAPVLLINGQSVEMSNVGAVFSPGAWDDNG
ncbi:MAG: hypothetical protein GC154_05595 [bacterium]|nr:hypothetical protein [bacterium]